MKKFTFLAFTAALFLCTPVKVLAQKSPSINSGNALRCGTMERLDIDQSFLRNQQSSNQKANKPAAVGDNYRTQNVVMVPVVVHIVLPNPFAITDADVQGQIDRLNLDFSGLNPDSTNAANFYNVRGHSRIQFCLARRTPGGQLTNGIERRSSSTGSNINQATDPIKRTASGGLDAWTSSQYLNIWVGNDASGIGLLGYASFPGTASAADDGVFLYFGGFGSSSCYTIPVYNKGRTGTHEVGHYFGLYHIWGDENGCTGDDFRQLPAASTATLPTGLFNPAGQGNTATDVGDTPNQAGPTTNCPSGTATDACATAAPGKMYQNQMDYSLDACLTLFTNKQVARMEWILDNTRASLKTSLGCQPPAGAITVDATPINSVNPGGFELIGCTVRTFPSTLSCPGSFQPKFRVQNNGLNALTSLTVAYRYDNGTAVTENVTVNIPSGGTYVHTFASSINATVGAHTIRFITSNPNGTTDQVTSNDELLVNFSVASPVSAPVTEALEAAAFPPAPWTVFNPNGDFTWQRTTPGRNASAGKLSINNFDVDASNAVDDFRSPTISVDPTKQYTITFDIAHKFYAAGGAVNYDTLAVLVSGDCGQTFTTLYKAAGPTLATAGSSNASYTAPAAGDWATRTIAIPASAMASGQIQVAFRNITRYGNWIHLDNINIMQLSGRDMKLVSIDNPGANSCSPVITPTLTVQNVGTETITSFQIGYRIGTGTPVTQIVNQSIAPNTTATVSFTNSITVAPGSSVITAYTFAPVAASGTGDTQNANDTLSKTFSVVNLIRLPVIEGFETSMPPAGWSLINPNNNVTWERRSPGRNSNFSAFFNNEANNVVGQIDELRTPFTNIAGADSVIVRFDLAHKNYPGFNDRLQVLTTNNCGTSFVTVFDRTGAALATAGSSTAPYLAPIASDWRQQRVALGGTAIASGTLGFVIRNVNGWGNNIFVDNINITGLYKRDLQLVSINQPGNLLCTTNITPSVTVRNVGSETVTGFMVSYTIGAGAPQTQTVTGISLARDAQTDVTLPATALGGPGNYSIKVYSFEPITASGTGDFNTANDTLTKLVSVAGTTMAPLAESFVGTTFPPNLWSVINPDGGIGWTRFNTGNGNAGSAYVNTFRYQTNNQKDDLATPLITYGTVDSVRLSFDVAAVTKSYPGSTASALDTLEVLITKDCGTTFTTVYKKWGNDLQTVNDPNSPRTTEFFPGSFEQWRRDSVDLTGIAPQGPVIVLFRVTNNFENNIFLDNISFTTRTLPAQLKQQGYLVLPTQFRSSFTVWHHQTPSTVRFISVRNSAGQTVWSKQFSRGAEKQVPVDLNGMAAGVYFVEIGYTDGNRNVVQRVVKY